MKERRHVASLKGRHVASMSGPQMKGRKDGLHYMADELGRPEKPKRKRRPRVEVEPVQHFDYGGQVQNSPLSGNMAGGPSALSGNSQAMGSLSGNLQQMAGGAPPSSMPPSPPGTGQTPMQGPPQQPPQTLPGVPTTGGFNSLGLPQGGQWPGLPTSQLPYGRSG